MSGTRSSGNNKPAFTAVGLNGHLMHGVHFHRHEHRSHHSHHGDKPNVGAPSIAGISDVSQSAGHHSHNAATVKNPTPTLIGFCHAGDVIFVFDGRSQIGSTTVHADGTWVFTTPDLLNGRHDFSVGTISATGGGMLTSNHLAVQVFAEVQPAPTAIATITSALDEFIDPAGNHHDNVIQNGGKTFDTSPKLLGTLSDALREGEVLIIYRDGKKLGHAEVIGMGWSFQDADLVSGTHSYTARVESASGLQGAASENFAIVEASHKTFSTFPVMATEDFLIFDTRVISRTTSTGEFVTFDLMESVRNMEKAGMTVKSYTEKDGFISIEVDWLAFAKTHPFDSVEFVSHRHVDNDKGGLNYYDTLGVRPFDYLLRELGVWTETVFVADGASTQSPLPPATTLITGIYDLYSDPSGNPTQSLIPNGGSTAASSHKVVGTFSVPLGWGDVLWDVYRDGIPLQRHTLQRGYDSSTNTWWVIDTDVPEGAHTYTARVHRSYGEQGDWSAGYSILETGPVPTAIATITSALDEFIDPAGNHHDNIIQNGGKTADTSPQLHGTLSAALHQGEMLAIYRDGQKIGTASVTGLGWSYQDNGITTGEHVYTASVISASGVQGVHSAEFVITETVGTSFNMFPMLGTEDFLIFDTRLIPRTTSDGRAISFDLLETVKILEQAGMTVKSYTDNGGFISIEVDWIAFMKTHPNIDMDINMVSHRHIDNDKGGLNYYNSIGFPSWQGVLAKLGTWTFAVVGLDGAEGQPARPAPATTITGIYDVYTDASGNPVQSLVPDGGSAASSTHKIMFTFSEPLAQGWISDWWEIYRDGVLLLPNKDLLEAKYDQATNTGWVIEINSPPGLHVYTARVPRTYGDQGPWSESYSIVETGPAPIVVATITHALDEFTDPGGNHHQALIENGSKTADTSPKLIGTLSVALHDGEVLNIYRDGVKLGHAATSGLSWSYQDADVTAGSHVYSARVESASGVQGAPSSDFTLIKQAENGSDDLRMFVSENHLIIDVRSMTAPTRNGEPASFDLEESVKWIEKTGLHVKSYLEHDGFITFEMDWMSYATSHLLEGIDLISHNHVDNASGGLDYYNSWGTPYFSTLLKNLESWVNLTYFMDGAGSQSAKPPVDVHITGIYDDVLSPNGESIQTLIPEGGATSNSTHTIVGTLSGPIPRDGGDIVIYRDGVKIAANMLGFRWVTVSGNDWTFEDRDVPPGSHVYTAQIERTYGKQGAISESYSIAEAHPAPTAIATITSALDEFTDPGGNHHQALIENGSKTADTSPKLIGTLSAALHDGEVLNIYRDGVKLGHAATSGLTWSYQDADVTAGSHVYTARVESASGVQGALSSDFTLIAANEWNLDKLPLLITEHFLILDARGAPTTTSSGLPMSFDITETVNGLNKLGLAAKISPMADGYICIEVDWMAYAASHPDARIDFVARIHVDTDAGPRNSYLSINVPPFGAMLKTIDTWVIINLMGDGAEWQSATPAPSTEITGIYDSYTNADGETHLALVPAGGETDKSTHRLEGTLSEPIRMGSDWVVIYRDGIELPGQVNVFELGKTYSSSTWWFVDTDVPPGPHTYTARVERFYGEQGAWSGSYSIAAAGIDAPVETSPSRMMLTDAGLIVDSQALQDTKADGAKAKLQLSAELMIAGKAVATLTVATDENGLVSFDANWKALVAAYPEATLRIVAHDSANDTATILDKHALSTLLGQMNHWVSMSSAGESAAFFDASDRGAQIHGGAGINTITIADDHQLIDLTSLTGKTVASTVIGIEKIDLGGQHNTLKIAMIDVLNLGETDLFRIDGKQQLMVNGKAGDSVKLSNTRVAGIEDGDWEQHAEMKVGGVTYNVYEHSTAHVELMVQTGVQLTMH